MEQELKDEVVRLINLRKTTGYDVKKMVEIIRNNVDARYTCCSHCAAQIKYAQRILTNWYNSQQTQEEQIQSPVVETKEPGCTKCGQGRKKNKG
jgi:uncharacterized membrane protein